MAIEPRKRTFDWGWTQEEIDDIRALYYSPERYSNVQIAMAYGVNPQSVARVTRKNSVSRPRKIKKDGPGKFWKPISHGTRNGYMQHKRRGETPCEPCREANAKRARTDRANLRDFGRPAPKLIGWRLGPGGIKVGVYANSPEEHKRAMRPVRLTSQSVRSLPKGKTR